MRLFERSLLNFICSELSALCKIQSLVCSLIWWNQPFADIDRDPARWRLMKTDFCCHHKSSLQCYVISKYEKNFLHKHNNVKNMHFSHPLRTISNRLHEPWCNHDAKEYNPWWFDFVSYIYFINAHTFCVYIFVMNKKWIKHVISNITFQ